MRRQKRKLFGVIFSYKECLHKKCQTQSFSKLLQWSDNIYPYSCVRNSRKHGVCYRLGSSDKGGRNIPTFSNIGTRNVRQVSKVKRLFIEVNRGKQSCRILFNGGCCVKRLQILSCGLCSYNISRSLKLPLVFLLNN